MLEVLPVELLFEVLKRLSQDDENTQVFLAIFNTVCSSHSFSDVINSWVQFASTNLAGDLKKLNPVGRA